MSHSLALLSPDFIFHTPPPARASTPAHAHLIALFDSLLSSLCSSTPPPLSLAPPSSPHHIPGFALGIPSAPYADPLGQVVQAWKRTGKFPFEDIFEQSRKAPNVASTFVELLPEEQERRKEVEEKIVALPDDSNDTVSKFLETLTISQTLLLLGHRHTPGSALDTLPPPLSSLLSSFLLVHPKDRANKYGGLTVGAKALSKHHHRDSKGGFWGNCTGTVDEKNRQACEVLAKVVAGAVWCNIHKLPHDIRVYEIRTLSGYGARWYVERLSLGDGLPDELEVSFRGFLEPQMEGGHEVGWVH